MCFLYTIAGMNAVGESPFSLEVLHWRALLEVRSLFNATDIGFPKWYSGILAFAIGKMDGIGGRKGWQWFAYIYCGYSESR